MYFKMYGEMKRLKSFVLCFTFTILIKEVIGNELIVDNSTLIPAKIVQDKHNNTDKAKTIIQREVIQHEYSKSKIRDDDHYEDNRLFVPPDISIILDVMNNIQDDICKEHVLLTLEALNNREKWAMQMLDSSAKFPSGILTGAYYQMGNYDECISVKLNERDHNIPRIKGQYCLAEVQPNTNEKKKTERVDRASENSTLYWAVCVPHSCKPKEVAFILDFILNGAIGTSNAVNVKLSQTQCHYTHDISYTKQEMIYAYVIISFISLICIATLYHIVMYYRRNDNKTQPGITSQVILSFSVINNVKKIFSTGESNLNLNCICGIKFLSMLLIICAHSLLFLISGPVINDEFMKEAIQKIENSIFLNNPLLVDTYLLISGFLLCRLVLLELEKRKGKVNFFILYIARYVRLTPIYLVIVGFYCTWLIRLDQGPLWNSKLSDERDRCISSWWANILYINNYVNVDKMCMFQSWYLAVDTQLFMLAPIIVYPLWKWRKIGEILLALSFIVSILIPSVVTYINNLDPTFMLYVPELRDIFKNNYFINSYIKTHMRANSYCVGLFFGYFVHRIQYSNYKFSKLSVSLGWLLSGVFMIASVLSVMIFYSPSYEYNALESAAYSVLHRVVWCLGVGWVLLACITGNGNLVEKFLSWKPFIPLSRITYCAYLANGIIELHSYGTVRQARYMSVYHLACDCFSHLVLTFTLAFFLCVLFESPVNSLEKILLKKEKKRNQNNENNDA